MYMAGVNQFVCLSVCLSSIKTVKAIEKKRIKMDLESLYKLIGTKSQEKKLI